ncbi:unnamed protein product [Meloidogyne enterolobii]|uniref:Uncharacterized protein n=1 Tax=Meloidogyne enterolobii TaxID=390850 RepID=A0ACB0ZKC4_MELEN
MFCMRICLEVRSSKMVFLRRLILHISVHIWDFFGAYICAYFAIFRAYFVSPY